MFNYRQNLHAWYCFTRPLPRRPYADLATATFFSTCISTRSTETNRNMSATYRQRATPARPHGDDARQTWVRTRIKAKRYRTPCSMYPPDVRNVYPSDARTSSAYTNVVVVSTPPLCQILRFNRLSACVEAYWFRLHRIWNRLHRTFV